jgi:hypothetical protein
MPAGWRRVWRWRRQQRRPPSVVRPSSFPPLKHCTRALPLTARSYPHIYVFRFHNMRNEKFKELRDELKDSSRWGRPWGEHSRKQMSPCAGIGVVAAQQAARRLGRG